MLVEIGGTVGDIESLPFLEAIRQLRNQLGRDNVLYLHVTLVPMIEAAGELKTKPTQHSVNELRRIGISPDVVVCRSSSPLSRELRAKIALFADLDERAVIAAEDAPRHLHSCRCALREQRLDELVLERLGLDVDAEPTSTEWEDLCRPHRRSSRAACGSRSSASTCSCRTPTSRSSRRSSTARSTTAPHLEIEWVDAETPRPGRGRASSCARVDGILIPGGFGPRAIEGKVAAVRYARESGTPFLGICLGMQCAVVEFARNVVRHARAPTRPSSTRTRRIPVVELLPEQQDIEDMGGTMRLGAEPVELRRRARARTTPTARRSSTSATATATRSTTHLRPQLEAAGLRVSGVFAAEGPGRGASSCADHPWFVASQFHPEFKSRPTRPQPLFRDFVGAAVAQRDRRRLPRRRRSRVSRWRRSRPRRPRRCSSSWPRSRARRGDERAVDRSLRRLPARPRPRAARGRRRRAARRRRRATSICRIPATAGESGTPILLCAHTSTR